ncbi:MAG: biopolymer transporter ExbD [Proteobacteria bacterium]|nr:biopolymer transporter ExbD [Burkholderiales bacterium]
MNFRRGRSRDEPEINLVPMIDVFLVILIFLATSTTFSKFAELQINLPQASAEVPPDRPQKLNVVIDATGRYLVNREPVVFGTPDQFSQALRKAAGDAKEPIIVISADAAATHQAVVNVMEAARIAGYVQITFTTQGTGAR